MRVIRVTTFSPPLPPGAVRIKLKSIFAVASFFQECMFSNTYQDKTPPGIMNSRTIAARHHSHCYETKSTRRSPMVSARENDALLNTRQGSKDILLVVFVPSRCSHKPLPHVSRLITIEVSALRPQSSPFVNGLHTVLHIVPRAMVLAPPWIPDMYG